MKLKELKIKLSKVQSFKKPRIEFEQYITPHETACNMIYTAHFSYDDIENKKVLDLCAGTGILGIASAFFNPSEITFIERDKEAVERTVSNLKIFNFKFNILYDHQNIGIKKELQKLLSTRNNNQYLIKETKKDNKNIDVYKLKEEFIEQHGDENDHEKQIIPDDCFNIDSNETLDESQSLINILNFQYEKLEEFFLEEKIIFDTVFMNPPFGTRNKHEDIKALDFALKFGKTVYSLHKRSTREYLLKKYPGSMVLAEIAFEIPRTYKFHKFEKFNIKVDLLRVVRGKI